MGEDEGFKPLIFIIARDWRERVLLKAQLLEEGYQVEGFEVPEDLPLREKPALIIFNTFNQTYSEETLKRIKEAYPEAPILIIADTTDRGVDYLQRYGPILFRPISIEELCGMVKAGVST